MSIQRPAIPIPGVRKRSRFGCIGCISQTVVVLLLAGVAMLLAWAVFTPWAYYLGGSFHLIPGWNGWGRMHSSHVGDYALWMQIYPGKGSRTTGLPSVSGNAILCTPRHQRFNLTLGGDFLNKHLGTNTDGQPLHLYAHQRSTGFGTPDNRPELEFYGKWQGPELVMDDHSSLARAFLSDGSVNRGSRKNQPWMIERIQIALTSGSRADFNAACEALAQNH